MPHKTKKASTSSREDQISALPDGVLQHVLGFLPAAEAGRTSLIARRWRYLWKSMRCLRINCTFRGSWEESSYDRFNKFVNCVLLLRDPGSTLDEVEIDYDFLEEDTTYINIWIRHALLCQAQVFAIKLPSEVGIHSLDGPPLVSQHLRRLELSYVELTGNILKFSSCPALEDLKITGCLLETSTILSQSVKRLSIKECAFRHDVRIRISVPNLISLQLVSFRGRTPLVESMLSLETAVVRPDNSLQDYCHKGDSGEWCGACADCCGNDDYNGGCVLLGAYFQKGFEMVPYIW